MGDVKGNMDLSNNLLISLEGISEVSAFKDPKSRSLPLLFTSKIQVSGNPVRAPYLLDDLEEVLDGETSWMRIYLEILTGDLDIKKDKEESIQWILDNKIDPKILEEEIKKNPEKMSVLIGKIPREYRKTIDGALDQIDLPPGFRDDKDLIRNLNDVGF
jgi:hypothetical protein